MLCVLSVLRVSMFKTRCTISLLILVSFFVPALAWSHQDVWLKNEQGDRITSVFNSSDPYSPKKTCGGCHNYSVITSGYHFQQGFDEMKDRYDERRPWILSPGMFGKWLPTAAAGRLAAKVNSDVRQIDLTTYDWIGAGKYSARHKIKSASCGSCHPGGGPLEYGRNGRGKADLSKTLIQGETANKNRPDGDYSSALTPDGNSHFRESGVVEADCLICHFPGYRLDDRNGQLYQRNYRWAATAGAGLGLITGAVFSYSNPEAGPGHREFSRGNWNLSQRPFTSYFWTNRGLFAPDGRMNGRLINKTIATQNCLQCHAEGDAKNTGTLHNATGDVHIQAGMVCTDCHGLAGKTKAQRLAHQIAKGHSLILTARNDLDGAGMKTCISCHSEGKYKQTRQTLPKEAKNPSVKHAQLFAGATFHTYLISCNGCHSTSQPLRAMLILDMSTGGEDGYTADDFDAVSFPPDYRRQARKPWQPWMMREKEYLPAVPKHLQWFGEKMTNGEIRPVPLAYVQRAARKVEALTAIEVNTPEGKREKRLTVVSDRDISGMIKSLASMGFQNVVFVADQIYGLEEGKIIAGPLKEKTLYYPVEHSVTALGKKLSYGWKGRPDGCRQCHDDKAPFFTRMEIKNIRGFLKNDYPVLKEPNSLPQYQLWGLRSVPAFE
jgi:hypothetical protein